MLSQQQQAALETPLEALGLKTRVRNLLSKENRRRRDWNPRRPAHVDEQKELLTVGDWLSASWSSSRIVTDFGHVTTTQIEEACESLGVTRKEVWEEIDALDMKLSRIEMAFDNWCSEHRDLLEKCARTPRSSTASARSWD